jgi:deoxycytidylate deaminase
MNPIVYLPLNAGPCVKAHVTAVLVSSDGDVFQSTNFCRMPQTVCPRETQGFAPGQGYHLCKDVCGQRGHAEVNVIDFALGHGLHKVRNAKLYVDYDLKVEAAVNPARVCGECQDYAKQAGVGDVVLGKPTGYMPLSHSQRQWGNYQQSRKIVLGEPP